MYILYVYIYIYARVLYLPEQDEKEMCGSTVSTVPL